MSEWTDELKQEVIDKYLAADPTPANSTEIVKEIAEEMNQSPNGVRMILIGANVYVKKDASSGSGTKTTKAGEKGEATKRVSKESQIAELKKAIEAKGAEIDEDILSKLTGKAAAYFTSVLTK